MGDYEEFFPVGDSELGGLYDASAQEEQNVYFILSNVLLSLSSKHKCGAVLYFCYYQLIA